MSAVTIAVVGAGGRGTTYASWALDNPDKARVVAIAEPRTEVREQFARQHGIDEANQFNSWRDLAEAGRVADAVLICTQDRMHTEPAIAFADAGWHVLLEKPMAPTPDECEKIVHAAHRGGGIFAVCHVLRYTPYTKAFKETVDSGAIGDIVSVQHLEPVGFWHFAHSYVRGPWRNEAESSSMLLAKSCHDLDWLRHVVGRPFKRVSSFGSLRHFRPENAPAKATTRCTSCPVEPDCAYSATRIYAAGLRERTFTIRHLVDVLEEAKLEKALQDGPYGACVYHTDNDVVDNQVVNMEFDNGVTGTFTVTAFTPFEDRKTRIFGSHGMIEGDGQEIRVFDFNTEKTTISKVKAIGGVGAGAGHGGGDAALIETFCRAVAENDQSIVLSGPNESLETHLVVFAAERARLEGTVEPVV
ncbi:Gfo/Idh/MocA family protein [Stackebrandtia nassauensis]|uniref:Oxidoreductase domain protein n=1 Tax=Stackebrandtia nassauensis (strain DSM 44728 / CIP 108903 / NRRL B-16338 / NBRC 102104 / LLR-40K-21) TaxID=446470 RepID=D3Q9S5_STANL|nr:Gfo/Idh/MocA family oxidoreductase [Stackebrandtia nassauensis]ADD44621.1 oxidoreductase domain protein [Stackebrandtia nassauensis DSM 44728]